MSKKGLIMLLLALMVIIAVVVTIVLVTQTPEYDWAGGSPILPFGESTSIIIPELR